MPNGSPLIIGQTVPPNTATDTTLLQTTPTSPVPALRVDNQSSGDGIYATSYDAYAVRAVGGPGALAAVLGQNPDFYGGIFTSSTHVALSADSAGPYGVIGRGVKAGVSGGSSSGYGVYGNASSGYGVYGWSARSYGVVGYTASPRAYSGTFAGGRGLLVQGDLFVTGAKMAAVRVRDGSHRALYCVESPESWFEDFGRTRLVRGRARVTLDPMFAAVVRSGDYHVFLSPEGDCGSLHVSRRSRGGFEVREQRGQKSTITFSYRVVARRNDVEAPRFAKVTVPSTAELAKPETLPTAIERSGRGKGSRTARRKRGARRR